MKLIIYLLTILYLIASCSKGISSGRVCAMDENFDALKGCKTNIETFEGAPETAVYSFIANGVNRDAKVQVQWFYEEGGKYFLVDSFSYYTKLSEEIIMSGMDRNFLPNGNYVIKTKIKDGEDIYEDEQKFIIQSSGKSSAVNLLVGDVVDPNGLVLHPNVYFDVNHPQIFVSTYIQDAKPNMPISIHFTHKEIGKFSKVFETNTGAKPLPKFLLYAYLPNKNLPLGEYRVEIILPNATFSAPFFIDATLESE